MPCHVLDGVCKQEHTSPLTPAHSHQPTRPTFGPALALQALALAQHIGCECRNSAIPESILDGCFQGEVCSTVDDHVHLINQEMLVTLLQPHAIL